jgi:hypothetical protein
LTLHIKRGATHGLSQNKYCLELKKGKVPIYKKADSQSEVIRVIPPGLKKINCDFYVTGLRDDGPYWYISHFKDDLFLLGYIHNDWVK